LEDQLKEDAMAQTRSMHGRDAKFPHNVGRKIWREETGVDGRIILKWVLNIV